MTPTDFSEGGPLFVDTNVFLRFLTNDVPEQAAAVEALFRRAAAGEVRLVTNTMVVAEIVTDALLVYAEANVDFIDAYNACWMRQRGLCGVATFDKKHYSRFEGIAVHTPGEG